MISNLLSKIKEFISTQPWLALGLTFTLSLALTIFVSWVFGAYSNDVEGMSKSEYVKKSKANEKIAQAALVKADEAEKRAIAATEQADALIKLNERRADLRSSQDKDLDTKIQKSDEVHQQENEKIIQDHSRDVANINSMPDGQRGADICSRIKRDFGDDPAFAEFVAGCNDSSP